LDFVFGDKKDVFFGLMMSYLLVAKSIK